MPAPRHRRPTRRDSSPLLLLPPSQSAQTASLASSAVTATAASDAPSSSSLAPSSTADSSSSASPPSSTASATPTTDSSAASSSSTTDSQSSSSSSDGQSSFATSSSSAVPSTTGSSTASLTATSATSSPSAATEPGSSTTLTLTIPLSLVGLVLLCLFVARTIYVRRRRRAWSPIDDGQAWDDDKAWSVSAHDYHYPAYPSDWAVGAAEPAFTVPDPGGRAPTMRLVETATATATAETRYTLDGAAAGGATGAFASVRGTWRALVAPGTWRPLLRARAQRRAAALAVEPPQAPDWIRPRAASPTQVLSPPMQAQLFFTLPPAGAGDASDWPGGAAAATRYAPVGQVEDDCDDDDRGGNSGDDGRYTSLPRTPRRGSRRRQGTAPQTPASIVRSAATYDLSPLSAGSTPRAAGRGSRVVDTPTRSSRSHRSGAGSPPGHRRSVDPAAQRRRSSPTPRRGASRAERRHEAAAGKVDDILRASWSDRAQLSPPASPASPASPRERLPGAREGDGNDGNGDGDGAVPGEHSPGVDDVDRLTGIDARLALLRRMEA